MCWWRFGATSPFLLYWWVGDFSILSLLCIFDILNLWWFLFPSCLWSRYKMMLRNAVICLPAYFHSSWWVHLLFCCYCCCHWSLASSTFQGGLRMISSWGILMCFSISLGVLRYPDPWIEQILDSCPTDSHCWDMQSESHKPV